MAFNRPATAFGGFGQTNTSTAFGSGGTTFGSSATPSVFGGQAQQGTTFGVVQPTTFGAQPAPAFGAQPTPAFGAQPQTTSLFGSTQPSTSGFGTSGGTLFGGTSTAGTTQNAFGTSGGGLFGSKPTGTAFGQPAASGTGFGGFGTSTSTTGFSGFGTFNQPTTTTAPSLFSGFGQTSTPTTAFNLGGTPAFGGFGMLGQQQNQQQQQQQQLNPSQQLMSSVCAVNIYGDERDGLIARFNALLAFAGVGKGYISPNQAIDYTPENDLYKFTSVVYNGKPSSGQKDNLVYINLNKKHEQVTAGESALVSSLSAIFGSPPNMTVVIDSIQHLDADKSRVVFYMNQKQENGSARRVANTDIVSHMMQLTQQQQLKDLGVYDVQAVPSLDEDAIAQYLEHPPPGINEILWKQAVRNNPDPKKFIPVPIVGFEGIKQRIKLQEEEAKLQNAFLQKLSTRIATLNVEYEKAVATIAKNKQNILAFNNRLLKVIVKQEITRNAGLALTPAEEVIRRDLESVAAMINANPTYNFRSKLSSMLSSMKLQCAPCATTEEKYVMDSNVLSDIRSILSVQQMSIAKLMETFNNHRSAVNIIKTDLEEILTQEQQ